MTRDGIDSARRRLLLAGSAFALTPMSTFAVTRDHRASATPGVTVRVRGGRLRGTRDVLADGRAVLSKPLHERSALVVETVDADGLDQLQRDGLGAPLDRRARDAVARRHGAVGVAVDHRPQHQHRLGGQIAVHLLFVTIRHGLTLLPGPCGPADR